MPQVSIIIRTKNEERWLGHCLEMLLQQTLKDFEIILVDNCSVDKTLEVAKRYKIKEIISIKNFYPGQALNIGINASSGKYIVCLSAHCIPKKNNWLSTLINNFDDDQIAAVYGRQIPVSFTSDLDKRDLLTVFGEDKRVQVKDYFFHNANSILRRDLWNKVPFDEEATNIEDRIWAKKIIQMGYNIIYEPEASVFHYHGLNHANSPSRAKGVVSIIEKIDHEIMNGLPTSMLPENLNVVAIILFNDKDSNSEDKILLIESIKYLKKSNYLKNIYLVSSNKSIADKYDLSWIDRDIAENSEILPINEILAWSLSQIENSNIFPEAILYLNHDYINRPDGLIDKIICEAQFNGYDCVFPGYIDYGHYWMEENNHFFQIDSSMENRKDRKPLYKALYGLGTFISVSILHQGQITGGNVGIIPMKNHSSTVRSKENL